MARGRFLSASIGSDERVDAIGSDFGRLLFTWSFAHADLNGRISAHPRGLRGKVMPLNPCSEDDVAKAVLRMHELGLVYLYEADGRAYLEFAGWAKNQCIRTDREKPRCPERTDLFPAMYANLLECSGSPPGGVPEQSAPREVKPSEVNRSKEELSSASDNAAAAPPQPVAQARQEHVGYQAFVDAWNDEAKGLPAVAKLNDARKRAIKKLCDEHGEVEALALLRAAARQVAGEPFWQERRFGFDNLVPGKVLQYAEKTRTAPTGRFTDVGGGGALDFYRRKGL